jgi:hypothetical protein
MKPYFWLELVNELEPLKNNKYEQCLKEATELVKIFSKSRKTAKTNSINNKVTNSVTH